MAQILSYPGLTFKFSSARISDDTEEKKHVIYTLEICFLVENYDRSPSVIERRYTHFLNLYNALKKVYPAMMENVTFPKKVLTGNFDNELISNRSGAFTHLLQHISGESKLRMSREMQQFLQEPEMTLAKDLLNKKDYEGAYKIFENSFILITKMFSDRSTAVILNLCKLVGTLSEIAITPERVKWADLAIHRFNGISDSDLLELYVPLIHTCIKIYSAVNKDTTELESQLDKWQKQGVKDVDKKNNLLIAVEEVEQRLYN